MLQVPANTEEVIAKLQRENAAMKAAIKEFQECEGGACGHCIEVLCEAVRVES